MAKITRVNGNVKAFASEQASGERTLFGQITTSNDLTAQFTPEFLRGWGIVGASDFPKLQDFNAATFTNSQMLAYLHQMGIPEYNAAQEYYLGSFTQFGGILYISLQDGNTTRQPNANPAWWKSLVPVQATETVAGILKIATTALAAAGVDDLSAMTALKTRTAIQAISIGAGQTRQNLLASRVLGTAYTNSTGRPITVIVTVFGGTGSETATVNIGGLVVYTGDPGYGTSPMLSFVVLNGESYMVDVNPKSGATLVAWSEVR